MVVASLKIPLRVLVYNPGGGSIEVYFRKRGTTESIYIYIYIPEYTLAQPGIKNQTVPLRSRVGLRGAPVKCAKGRPIGILKYRRVDLGAKFGYNLIKSS